MTPRVVIPIALTVFSIVAWIRMSPEWRQGIIWGVKFLSGVFAMAAVLMGMVFALVLNHWDFWNCMFK